MILTIKKETLEAIADALKEEGAEGPFRVPEGFIEGIHYVANKPSDNDAEEKLRTVANLYTASQFNNLKDAIKEILEPYRE